MNVERKRRQAQRRFDKWQAREQSKKDAKAKEKGKPNAKE